MNIGFDRNLFTQIGLDSASLTILGAVIHSFREPGEYRGSVRKEGQTQATFHVSVDGNSSVSQVDIDLASLADPALPGGECNCEGIPYRYSLNPKGYAVFHVSRGAGGFDLQIRRGVGESPSEAVFDSRRLDEGDIFSAIIVRPGTYSISNTLGQARAEAVVSYPEMGGPAYRPPDPVRVQVAGNRLEPRRIELKPAQGLLFDCKEPARIRIELVAPDDGPNKSGTA